MGIEVQVTGSQDEAVPVFGPTFRMAVTAGVVEAVRLHVARGDRLDARDASGMTPFLLACSRNKVAVCRVLLEAGADPWLLTPSGATALEVARAAGAAEVGKLLEQLVPVPTARQPLPDEIPVIDGAGEFDAADDREPGLSDLDCWEPEPEPIVPMVDPCIRQELEEAQAVIARHVPTDDSAGWDDVELLLPNRASSLSNPEDLESIGRLRVILLRAIREGSVPEQLLEELAQTPDCDADRSAVQALRRSVQDLGAECDERFEYSTPWEDFRVQVDPQESPDEEEAIADALSLVESLLAPRNDPLRLYQREFARVPLLTADEEVSLGRAMEQGIARACIALISWTEGLHCIAEAAMKVRAGQRSIRSLRAGAAEVPVALQDDDSDERISAAALAADEIIHPAVLGPADENAEVDPDTAMAPVTHEGDELAELISLVDELKRVTSTPNSDEAEARRLVSALNLARGFLVELLAMAESSGSTAAVDFREAMATYLQARDAMVRGNLRLAFFHARKALSTGLDLADLTQEANLGLIRAAEKFDWRRGYRFSTYATWWVRQQVLRSVADDGRLVRLPVHLHEKVRQARRVARSLEAQTGLLPTHAEIASQMGLPKASVDKWFSFDQAPEAIDDVELVGRMSLDAQDRYVLPDPSEAAGVNDEAASIHALLSSLKPKEEQVLRMRFGLGGIDPMTLEEVGACFDFTRERARQIENAALKKLKHPSRRKTLAGLAGESGAEPDLDGDAKAGASPLVDSADTDDAAALPKVRANGLQRVLDLAAREGLVVVDERERKGSVWVHLVAPRTAGERKVLRELLRLGFELWPGKGYWR
jgi:RNA polymerase primary sigma factor